MPTKKANDKLAVYREKRRPDATPEPFGAETEAAPGSRFVVQRHAARALHYDFRLEHDGVLLSWAVPKGPSLDPANKRLAVHVEDHPLDYIHFEGTIPAGNYGAGAVIVWDRGRYEPVEDFGSGLATGKLLFDLYGYKLRGRFTLIKTKRGPKDWLLIKERDAYVRRGDAARLPEDSVLSGRTVEQVAAGEDLEADLEDECRDAGARPNRVSFAEVKPMRAMEGKPFSDPEWVFEIDYDGRRLLAGKDHGRARLESASREDFAASFPELVEALDALPFEHFLLDGVAVVPGAKGLPSRASLTEHEHLAGEAGVVEAALRRPAALYAFDLLLCGGYDLRSLPLTERKRLLSELLPSAGPIRLVEHIAGAGEAMLEQLENLDVQGIIAKRASAHYIGRRSRDWIAIGAPARSGKRPEDD
ncbi:MAG TPA: DNA polymerase ligase N-terminal domain-containing protein [Gammaproteobacteria bacterium]|nr:DNA polymerase ligase N-terminal domain-containing protein [Gammaproteobacteria bacterium]